MYKNTNENIKSYIARPFFSHTNKQQQKYKQISEL